MKETLSVPNPEQIGNQNFAELLAAGNSVCLFVWQDSELWPVRYVSDNVESIFGYNKQQFIDREVHFKFLIHEDDLPRVNEEVKRLKSGETGFRITHNDYRIKHKNGRHVWVSDTTIIKMDTDDGVPLLFGYLIDITERKELEIKLETERNRLQLLLDATRLGTWEWNPQSNLTSFNDRWAQIFGWSREEIEQSPYSWSSRLHPDDYDRVWRAVKDHLDGITPFYESQHRIRHRDGHYVYVLDRGRVIERDEHGKATRYAGTVTDVTEQKQAEINARRAASAKNVFLANMSHEVRTPLHGILGLVSVLENTALDTHQHQLLMTVKESGDHLLQMLNDLLDLTRSEEGQLKLNKDVLELARILQHIESMYRAPIEEKGVKFIIHHSKALPERIFSDRARLIQILTNLLNNAVKFTEQGTIMLSIDWSVDPATTTQTQAQGELLIKVRDTGAGIRDTQRIWQLFEQEHQGLSKKQSGSGLGLAIVRNLVQLLDGEIEVDSEPNRGTCFSLRLPMYAVYSDDVNHEALDKPKLPTLVPRRILIVDDNPINQLIVSEMLTSLDQHVTKVSSGHEAVEMLKQNTVDVVFMDLHMPTMDGIETTLKIRDLPIHQPHIVALTANAYPETRTHALRSGMDDYLTKPFVKADLARILNRLDKVKN